MLNDTTTELFVLASIFLIMIVGIIFIQEGTRRIPIVSAQTTW